MMRYDPRDSPRAAWRVLVIAIVLIWGARGAEAEFSVAIAVEREGGDVELVRGVDWRMGEVGELVAVVRGMGDEGAETYYSGQAGRVWVEGEVRELGAWDGAVEIEWFRVEPVMMHGAGEGHDETAPGWLWYTNARVPWSPRMREGWIGFDRIEYVENPVAAEAIRGGGWRVVADARPTDGAYDRAGGMGVMRYGVEVTIDGRDYRTAGVEVRNERGIGAEVFRVTVRRDDSFLGWATSYFNVPGLYGSHERQVDDYVGVDCADLLVGAYRRWRGGGMTYTGVNKLMERMERVGGANIGWRGKGR